MLDLTNPFKDLDVSELELSLDELRQDLVDEEDEFMIYELEEDIELIESLIKMHSQVELQDEQ